MPSIGDLAAYRGHLKDLGDSWQVRALKLAVHAEIWPVMLSILAHNYGDAMPVLLDVAFPGFAGVRAPFLCSAARIHETGRIVADRVERDGTISRPAEIFASEAQMQGALRRFADLMALPDRERVELFKCAQRWVVADRRLDPMFDRQDPDAKRFALN